MLARVAPPRIYPAGSLDTRGHQHAERRAVRRRRRGLRIERTMAFAFDTLVQVKRLREAGFDEKQAEALTTVLRDAVKPFDTSELATKADLAALSVALKADLLQWVIGLVLGAVVLNAFVVIGSIFGLLKLLGR
jgi:hypothetical protein